MRQLIKIDDQVKAELDKIKISGQTYSSIIDELLDVRRRLFELLNVIEGSLKFREWQCERLEKDQSTD